MLTPDQNPSYVDLADALARATGCERVVRFEGECNASADDCTVDHDSPTCSVHETPWPCRGTAYAEAAQPALVAARADALRDAASKARRHGIRHYVVVSEWLFALAGEVEYQDERTTRKTRIAALEASRA